MLARLISTVPALLMREKLSAGVQAVLHCLNFRHARASREKIEPILAWGVGGICRKMDAFAIDFDQM